ncbi:GMC family oxidoreductase N-terminal domain-containing protein [Streptomyces sp. RB6PN25]|uniref:GMC family oxidoreductase N-terminal domain-containing protein n=1 Tax=Streptomyces humicola TaxID=2953240 RepID=A0ABT1PN21_9ACTN|nr:GMC family oxidoreductase N-terminal domain-containing protein [Streptomyces humicola]
MDLSYSNVDRPPTRCTAPSSKPCSGRVTPLTDDVNGYRQEGFAAFDRNVHRGRRLSAARAYLHPAMSRPNLEVRTRAGRSDPAPPAPAPPSHERPDRGPFPVSRRARRRRSRSDTP